MIIIISKIVFILSLLGILYIIVRKFPALSKLSEEPPDEKFFLKEASVRFENIIKRFVSGKFFQTSVLRNLEKSLRKFKIMTLKIHNFSDKFIRKIKRNSDV